MISPTESITLCVGSADILHDRIRDITISAERLLYDLFSRIRSIPVAKVVEAGYSSLTAYVVLTAKVQKHQRHIPEMTPCISRAPGYDLPIL
jgi:hypothetical protein